VILYKDASANKGGVTSSSFEVLASLAMTDEEHSEYMQVKDLSNPPQFYKDYVENIQEAIENNAAKELYVGEGRKEEGGGWREDGGRMEGGRRKEEWREEGGRRKVEKRRRMVSKIRSLTLF
jgi:hypothetical protein